MPLSKSSVNRLATELGEDFSVYLNEVYRFDLDELLASAADNFISLELGELDDALHTELAIVLMDTVKV